MINYKELRIGSHVLANGVKAQVIRIDAPKEHDIPKAVILGFKAIVDGEVRYAGCLDGKGVEPIPITEELLSELGFDCIERLGDCSLWAKGKVFIKHIGERYMINVDDWLVATFDSLHELENLYYHHFKKELIEE